MVDYNSIFNSKTNDILRELSETELLELENLYKNQSTDLKYHYLSIYNQRIWDKKLIDMTKDKNVNSNNVLNPGPLRKKFYTHRNGNFLKTGTYLSFTVDCKFTIACHSFEASLSELEECLRKTELIPWRHGPLFTSLYTSVMSLVEKIVLEKGAVIERNRECIFYLIQNNIARNLYISKVDEICDIRSLTKENVEIIHSLWPHNDEGSVDFLLGLAILNKGFGLFLENGLIAWIFQNEFLGIGILHVVAEQRRKGFAAFLSKTLIKEIALSDENVDVSAFTVHDNLQSQNLLKAIGFQKIISTYWMQLKNLEAKMN